MDNRNLCWIALALLAGCSKATDPGSAAGLIAEVDPANAPAQAPTNKFGFAEAVAPGPDLFGSNSTRLRTVATLDVKEPDPASPELGTASVVPPPQQQIAYSYGFGFRVAKERIAELQQAHIALCEAMREKCRILRVSQAKGDFDGLGELKLQVAASEAGALDKALAEPARKLGGDLVSSVRNGEDLTDEIVDNEARLQARLVLRGKLTEILRSNRGSVDELIKAEKAVADVNEDIDATRTRLAGYRTRIRFSDISIDYQPEFGETQLGFARPVMTAARSIGTTLGMTIAGLIYLLTALVPITLFVIALRWVLHRLGLRLRFWRKPLPVVAPDV